MTGRTVVFLESNTTGTGRLFMRAARAEGCEPVLLATRPGLYPFAEEESVRIVEIDTADEAAVLELCEQLARDTELKGLTSTSDYYILSAARLAGRLGLPGPSVAGIETCRDKQLQHEALRAAGVRVPASLVAGTPDEAASAARQLGLPVVIKPVGGSGSVGVRLCRTEDEVAQHAAVLLSRTLNERGIPIRRMILLQQLVQGPEYSVETFAGEVVGITGKHVSDPPVFVELGHDFPAALDEADARAIAAIALRAVAALDLNWGAAHTELRLTPGGPVIIEVNSRMAGGFIPELVRRATGIDLIRELTRRVVGKEARLGRNAAGHASIRFFVPDRSGTLAALNGVAEARAVPDVCDLSLYREPGFTVALAGDFHDRIGHVMTASHDAAAARASADHALSLLSVALA
ncbi:ATP-grasp domain-containing protein [Sphingomonas oligophenolica]|uniref:ATP-grasp domain-containing protein n=1 Tax=Sphingomonas oligophenolica TaxID=301154 RepID=A0ABU9Y9G0_9SPHN